MGAIYVVLASLQAKTNIIPVEASDNRELLLIRSMHS